MRGLVMRRPLALVVLMALAVSLLGPAGPAQAASIERAEVCVEPDGTLRFLVELTEPVSEEIAFRLNADDGPFPSDFERFEVNFDTGSGIITRVTPAVASFGTPPQDRWVDGPVTDFSLTALGGGGQWRVEGGLAPGPDAFVAGDTVWGAIVRPFPGGDVVWRDLLVTACGAGGDETATEVLDFAIEAVDHVPFHLFNVLTPGPMTATLEWTGISELLTVELTGPRRPGAADPLAPYAEVTGSSPLTLTYDVTPTDLTRGTAWRLVVRDHGDTFDAEGTVELTTPADADLREQFEAERIRLRSGDVWPSAADTAAFESDLTASGDGLHGIISLSRACNCQENRVLEEAGFHRQSFLPGRDALGLVEPGASRADPRLGGLVQFLTLLEPEDKIDPHVLVGDLHSFVLVGPDGSPLDYVRNADGTLNLTVEFHHDISSADIATILSAHTAGFEALAATEYRADVPPSQLVALAEHDAVAWIEEGPAPGLPTLDWARDRHGVDTVHAVRSDGGIVVGGDGLPVYDGWTGAGITATVEEGGRIDATHPDLAGVVNASTDDFSSHKTHVAGTLGGTGVNSAGNDGAGESNGDDPFRWRGIAPEASLYDARGWTVADAYDAIMNFSSDLSSHSHTMSYDGRYNATNARLDALIAGRARTPDGRPVPGRPVVWAAGNEGPNNNPQYGRQPGLFGLTTQAKNLILVGNWCAWCRASYQAEDDPVAGRLNRSSSMGPAYDGRLMPTVVAHGSNVVAPDTAVAAEDENDADLPGDRYSGKTGTSMATPVVAGVVSLLLEAWQFLYADPLGADIDDDGPLPSTIRAVVAHTAVDVVDDDVRTQASVEVDSDNLPLNGNDGDGVVRATVGPDYATGFGTVDAAAAIDLLADVRTEDGVSIPNRIVQGALGQGGVAEYEFAVDASGEIKVTLAWDDIESARQGRADEPMLVNDLDLELVSPSGQVFYPWRLGHRAVDADGDPIPDAVQQPGTPIEVDIQGPRPATRTRKVTIPSNDPEEDDETRRLFLDYIPQASMDPGGAWVAARGKDHLNTIEQVLVDNAAPGRWTARVTGFDVKTDLQAFALVGMPYPDLPDIRVFASDQFGLPELGEDVTFTWSATNLGTAPASSGADYRLLLSTDFAVDDDDVVLTDTRGSGRLTATQINSGSSITSTVRITQADADAVLGASGVTVDGLIAADVLMLLEVDPIGTNDVLEHHEINVAPLSPGRLVDVVVVYDRSGSMNAGVRTSLGTRRKVDILDDSANVFFDLLRIGAGDRLGVVSFAGGLEDGTTARHVDLTAADEDSVGDAARVSGQLIPFGGTDIRAGLEEALATLPSADSDERRRVIVFFSDGEHTSGADPRAESFLDRFPSEDVRVFSVGFGTEGGSSYSGIDTQLLQLLADANAGGFARVTDRPVDVDKFFVDALGGAIEWPTILDPVGDLPAGDTHIVDVGVTEEDGQAAFVLTWDDPAGDLDLSLVTPGGTEIGAANAAQFGDGVEHTTGGAHALVKVQLPLVTGADEEQAGTWQMRIRNAGTGTVTYSASAIARSTVRGEVTVEPPGDGVRDAGEPVEFDAAYRTRDGAPIGDATVTVVPRVPLIGVGDVLAAAGLSAGEIDAVPPDEDGDDRSQVERMIVAVRDRWGTDPIPVVDGAPFVLPADGSGGYAGSFGATSVPGPYTFTTRSSFRTAECADSTREQASTLSVEPSVDPLASGVDLTTTTPGDYELRVVPVHTGGGFVGPGRADDVLVAPGGTLVAEGPVIDNLDGSYLQRLRSTGTGRGEVEVEVDGVALPTEVIATGGPVATVITPGGGSTQHATPVILAVGVVGSISDVTGVLLKGPGGTVPVEVTAADTSAGTLSVLVPEGLEPGAYQILLTTVEGANAPLKPAEFLAVGLHDPVVLLALDDAVASTADGTTADELLAVLHAVQGLPTGTFLTPADKTAAMREVVLAILAGEGQVTLPAVQAVRSLGAVDARYFDVGPVPTGPGEQVVVDLGGDILATFDAVLTGGTTSVAVLPGPQGIDPSRTGTPYLSYDVTTTATFDGGVTLTFPYREGDFEDESSLQLFHLGEDGWQNTTTQLDTSANRITGKASSLSPFVILQGGELPDAIPPPTCFGLRATIVGTAEPDHLVGTPGVDVIVGLGGDDVIEGLGGDDVLCGGPGNDRIVGGPGNDRLDGGEGDDVLEGGGGDDRIVGGPGADFIDGGEGDDVVDAGPGNDVVRGGNGHDRLTLGLGDDAAVGGDGADWIDGGPGDDEIEGQDGPDVLLGGPGVDRILGGDDYDLIRGGDGPDELSGDGGDDVLFGDGGDDVLHGREGTDATHGGDGIDTCSGEVRTSCEVTVTDPNRGKGVKGGPRR